MKKIVMVFMMFLLFAGVVSASGINGDYKGYPIVKIFVNGNAVTTEVPAVIIDGVTMVPLRVVSEAMGGLIGWDKNTYSVNIVPSGQQPEMPKQNETSSKVVGPLTIYSNDGKTYIGKLTADIYDLDSVFNEFGTYGGKFSTNSIWNEFGIYGSELATTSAFNKLATKPPIILDGNGDIVGYLTTNSSIKGAVTPVGLKQFLSENGY